MLIACLSAAAPGCLLPPPLQLDSPSRERPVIVGGDPDFFNLRNVLNPKDPQNSFEVSAIDENPDITVLQAKLFLQNIDQTYLPMAQGRMAQDPATLTYSATLSWPVCQLTEVAQAPGRDHLVFVFVSDAGFTVGSAQPPQEQVLGNYDFKWWVVRCE